MSSMKPTQIPTLLAPNLYKQRFNFHFNPQAAPHFGRTWGKKTHTVKSALFIIQPVPEEVLMTVLLEVEAILSSKWLGYVLINVADTDSVTLNSLLLG